MKQEDCHRVKFNGEEYLLCPEATGPDVPFSCPMFKWEEFESMVPGFALVVNAGGEPRPYDAEFGYDSRGVVLREGRIIGSIGDITWL